MRRMRIQYDIREISNMVSSLSHYSETVHSFYQLVGEGFQEKLKTHWDNYIEPSIGKSNFDNLLSTWNSIDIYQVAQMWGNGSGGWGGMGVSSMTQKYTTIIENIHFKFVFIYYDGKLAYIAEFDNKYLELIKNGYNRMPARYDCQEKLTIIYINNY